ncbi:MAG: hypothetical protein KDB07_06845 [Planctomycetes bacterium]|nr:hypothetical protein [Planctomycetota bacterium]
MAIRSRNTIQYDSPSRQKGPGQGHVLVFRPLRALPKPKLLVLEFIVCSVILTLVGLLSIKAKNDFFRHPIILVVALPFLIPMVLRVIFGVALEESGKQRHNLWVPLATPVAIASLCIGMNPPRNLEMFFFGLAFFLIPVAACMGVSVAGTIAGGWLADFLCPDVVERSRKYERGEL